MIARIVQWNRWYDRLDDTNPTLRFMIAMTLIMIGNTMLIFGESKTWLICGVGWMFMLLLGRMIYLWKKKFYP